MRLPKQNEMGPILGGAGVFVLCTYAAVHQFVFPRSEAEAAIFTVNRRIDTVEQTQVRERQEYLNAIKEIRDYILSEKKN